MEKYDVTKPVILKKGVYKLNGEANFNYQLNRVINWDGFRSGFTFGQFFFRFVFIFTVYKIYDMVCFDYFLLMRFHFFQYYYPEVKEVYANRKYGYNIKRHLLKLLVILPGESGLAAWIGSLF